MAKSTNPDRQQRRDRRDRREPSEFSETTLSLDRVTRVVKGGRRMRFRAVVVVGNKKGKVGMGTGKANEVQVAVQKATKDARRHMIRIPLVQGTIPHDVQAKYKAAKVRILPASPGTGILAGGAMRVILEHAGVQDVLSKRFGTTNKLVNAQAVFAALALLRVPQGMELDATPDVFVDPAKPGSKQEPLRRRKKDDDSAGQEQEKDQSAPEVKEISRADVQAQQDIARKSKIQE